MKMKSLYKKSVALLILLFAVGWQAMATESCGIVFNLYDEYGDGWNGNKLVVSDGNALNEELTFDEGSSTSFTLMIEDGSHVTLSWIEGSYSDECTFSVQFENGYPIYEGSSLIGTTYEFDLNCDDPYLPLAITVSTNNDDFCTVSGGGNFLWGESCTVTAMPNEGYFFWCWIDSDEEKAVSTEATYTFTVSRHKNIVAFFRQVSNADNIVFADPNVEIVCLQQGWDTNDDDYLSYDEAAAVTDLGYVFMENENITSFNELQYFTGLTSIGSGAFEICTGLASIEIPNTVTSIADEAFFYCTSLSSITIPNSVTSIGRDAFESCTGLTTITIPSSVTEMGDYAFALCTGLTYIVVQATVPPVLGTDVFHDVDTDIPVYVPYGTVSDYQSTDGWSVFTSFIEGDYNLVWLSLNTVPEEGGTLMTQMWYEIETPFETEEPVEEQDVSIVARANEGWRFVYWTANDEVVSYDNVYTFHLSEDTYLEAHFEQCEL